MGMIGTLSGLGSLGSQYDFTNMTNAQLASAAESLGAQGKISSGDALSLRGIASGVDTVAINHNGPTANQTLNDPTKHNFIQYLQEGVNWETSTHNAKAADYLTGIMNDLQRFQSNIPAETGSSISTTA